MQCCKYEDKKHEMSAGLKTDFDIFLGRLVDSKTLDFSAFVALWKETKMFLLSAGRQSEREVRQFFEECFQIATRYIMPPFNYKMRVGALFLFYGLFHSQICLPKIKFRITFCNWVNMKALRDEAISKKDEEVVYIFYKLILQKAYHFVTCPKEISWLTKDTTEKIGKNDEHNLSHQSVVMDLFNEEALEQISVIHDQYYERKCFLNGPNAKVPSKSLDVAEKNLAPTIRKCLKVYQERKAENPFEEKQSVRARLKAKAFFSRADASCSRRWKAPVETDDEDWLPEKKVKIQKRMEKRPKMAASSKMLECDKNSKDVEENKTDGADPVAQTSSGEVEVALEHCSMPQLLDNDEEHPSLCAWNVLTEENPAELPSSGEMEVTPANSHVPH